LKKTETKLKPGQTDWFRFGSVRFFREKTGLNRFGSVFPVLARCFRFGSVFPVWLCFGSFFLVFSVSVRFFIFLLIKPKPNWTGRFFQNFNKFFFQFSFFSCFFSNFLDLINFSVFFSPQASMSSTLENPQIFISYME